MIIKIGKDIELKKIDSVPTTIFFHISITWEVWKKLNGVSFSRVGIIRRQKEPYLEKKIGWRNLPVYKWYAVDLRSNIIITADTRTEVLIHFTRNN